MSRQSEPSPGAPPASAAEYSPEERALLLQTAHEAIVSALEQRECSSLPDSPHLSEPRGAFTTLYLDGKLRGCVGYPVGQLPLHQTVAETARAAAFDDPRFQPVTIAEAARLRVSISVLSPLVPILPGQIEVGRHGLLVSDGSHRGLLLPQVAVDHDWTCTEFLDQTCRKGGLPSDAWQHGARIEAFTAEVFGDPGT